MASIDVLLVAGGGGGANTGSGGGAGGFIYTTNHTIDDNVEFNILIGTGGTGGVAQEVAGQNGGNTTFSTLTAIGGGGGKSHGTSTVGSTGGSGGGAPILTSGTSTGGSGTAGQGYNGGKGLISAGWSGGSGGGGGAGQAGADGGNVAGSGKGGDGLPNPIAGSTVGQLVSTTYWLAGGGGAGEVNGSYAGAGGIGGGGASAVNNVGASATANTGGGGAGGSYSGTYYRGGNGGSGVAIIKYKTSDYLAVGGTITTYDIYTIHTFTSNGTFTIESLADTEPSLGEYLGCGLGTAISNQGISYETGLTAYYKYDSNIAPTVGAITGTGYNLEYVSGKFSDALNFNGNATQYINMGTSTEFEGGAEFSISLWLKLDNMPTTPVNVLARGIGTGGSTNNYEMRVDPDGQIYFIGRGGGGQGAGSGTMTAGAYHHIVFTKTGTTAAPNVRIFFDGTQKFAGALGVQLNTGSTQTFIIGGRDDYKGTTTETINGQIDDFAFYKKALSPTEVTNIYNYGVTGGSLTNYYTTGTTYYTGGTDVLLHCNNNSIDYSGNNRSGAVSNITYGPGRLGNKSTIFNGTSSSISLGTNVMPLLNDFTISVWFKTTSAGPIFIYEQAPATNNSNFDMLINGGKLGIEFNNGSTVTSIDSTITVNDDKWHNAIFTRTGANGSLYIDGNLKASSTTLHTITVGHYTALIGKHLANTYWFNGNIDELFIESKVWTPEQVRRYYTYALGRMAL